MGGALCIDLPLLLLLLLKFHHIPRGGILCMKGKLFFQYVKFAAQYVARLYHNYESDKIVEILFLFY